MPGHITNARFFKCFKKKSMTTLGQHPSQQDDNTMSQSLHDQGRQRGLACWQRKSPVQRFRMPHWEIHTHGFAEELLILHQRSSLLSFWRNVRRGIHVEHFLRKQVYLGARKQQQHTVNLSLRVNNRGLIDGSKYTMVHESRPGCSHGPSPLVT